jgi:gamma-glutamyltranspeptidase / glutathione hydrolase
MKSFAAIGLLSLLLITGGTAAPNPTTTPLQQDLPEAASGWSQQRSISFSRQAVATANPYATEAAHRILRAGGSAVDAVIAAQMVLTLVEPQSSGIGGGAFLVHAKHQQLQVFDGRETAPAAVTESLFMEGGKPMAFSKAVVGGRAVGTPGLLRMLELAHRQHGRLAWSTLFTPAIALAEQGFAVSPRLHQLLASEASLKEDPQAANYFYQANGQPWPVGYQLRNPELAQVFKRIAQQGTVAFYSGEIAQAMVRAVRGHPHNSGLLSLPDLDRYQPKERAALCFPHDVKNVLTTRHYLICGVPPPSSGAIAIGQILGLLSSHMSSDMSSHMSSHMALLSDPLSASWLHHYTEASRLAFADRAQFVADPDFVSAPAGDWMSLLNPHYLNARATLITPARMPNAPAGNPAGQTVTLAAMPHQPEAGTSHISVVDAFGNALAMTTTIESGFGARLMVSTGLPGGFLLNNQLTDFSFQSTDETGRLIANRVQPLKRPRSSMSPTLIFERQADGSAGPIVATLGSPGGAAIIHYTTKTILGLLHQQRDAQQAITLPNYSITAPQGQLQIEKGALSPDLQTALKAFGQSASEAPLPSGIQALERVSGQWRGAADPRREGQVAGD